MPWADPELSSQFFQIFGTGPVAQTSVVLDSPLPSTIAANGAITTGLTVSNGYKIIAVGVTSSQAGTVTVQRFLDREGNVPVTATLSTPVVAATALVVVVNSGTDGLPFSSFIVTVNNSAGTIANVTKFYVLLQAN